MAPHSISMEESTQGIVKPKPKVPRHVLESFNKLVLEDAQKQSKASIIILKYVDNNLQTHSGTELPDDVAYIVRRLVSGLVSNRLRAREGFYTALQALLQLHPSTAPFTLHTLKENCCDKRAPNKQEARDLLIAELLGYGALIRSGQVHCNSEIRSRIITRLFQMRQMKTYLDTMATQFLVNLMEKSEGDVVYNDVLSHVKNEVSKPVEELSPCLLWLRLILLKYKLKTPVWLTSTLIPKNYPAIGHIVLQTGGDLPKVHPLLEEVVSSLASCDDRRNSPLVNFWMNGLAPYLEGPSPSRLQLLFHVLQLLLPKLKTGSEVAAVVSDPLISVLLTTVSRHDKDLSCAARGLASALLQLVTANQDESSDVQLAVVRALIIPPGSVRFDQLTGTKLLAQMKTHFSFTTIKGIAEILIKIMRKRIENVKPLDQSCAAHTLKNLIMHPKAMSEDHLAWRTKQVINLMKVALFTQDDPRYLQGFRDAFFKALSHHAAHIKEYKSILLSVVGVADQELRSCETRGTSPISAETKELWSEVYGKLCSIQNEKEVTTIANEVFQVLYCQMALHLFIDSDGARDIIDELTLCHKEVMKKMKKKKKKNSEAKNVEEELQWVEVVTELLLSLLTHEKSLFRFVAQGVFWLMSPLMTHTALTLIVDVLDPAKSDQLITREENQEERFNSEDEDEEEEELEDEETMDIQTEEQNMTLDSNEGDDADDDDEDEDDDEEEDEDEDEEEDGGEPGDETMENMNLFDLKKKMLALTGNIDEDVDMDSVPQEELNNLDNQLGALMAEYQSRHKKKKKGVVENLPKDEKSLMHFRTRVCDLIDVYIKKAPNMGIILDLVNPLLSALHTADQDTRQIELQCRLRHTIHMLGKVRKFESVGSATIDGLLNTLDTFFSIASEMPESFTEVVKESYLLVVHCGCQLLGENSHKPDNPLIKVFANHIEKLFTKNTITVKVHAFSEPCSFDLGGLWSIVKLMVKCAFDPEIKIYRRSQALHILQKLYQNQALVRQMSEDNVTDTEEELAQKTVNILNSFQTPESMNAQYIANLFSLLRVIHKSHALNGTHKSFNWEEISTAVSEIRQRISKKTLNSFRGQYNGLQQALKLPKFVCNVKTPENVPQINTSASQKENTTESILEEGTEEKQSKKQAENLDNSEMNGNKQEEEKMLDLGNEEEDTVMNIGEGETDKHIKKRKKSEQVKIISIENKEEDAVQKVKEGKKDKQKKKKWKNESLSQAEVEEPINESIVESLNHIKKKKQKREPAPLTEVEEAVNESVVESHSHIKKKKKQKHEPVPLTEVEEPENDSVPTSNEHIKKKKRKHERALLAEVEDPVNESVAKLQDHIKKKKLRITK